LALFAYIFYACLMAYLFEPESDKRAPIDVFYDMAPEISMTVCAFMLVFLILMAALIIHGFWNRFISNIFSIREINYHESLSIILIYGLFTIP